MTVTMHFDGTLHVVIASEAKQSFTHKKRYLLKEAYEKTYKKKKFLYSNTIERIFQKAKLLRISKDDFNTFSKNRNKNNPVRV
ncbi:MAG: hypothetical protein DCC43_00455 [Candidatus Brocadia sp.]|jgi:hypothetical protein|nr:hypothetical protein [Candidatus Brocadia fulgida]MCC6324846.1 hypothetical protein [Candidatus Brocadia sp.]MCE7910123.1 hypothetical protein [Candidatus Brocadia sp. AMX3]MDG5996127.1 hypothetical protein [Candidatus Brocadia sp.]RIK03496.1 MAG: hypothetical protein DCC43_00455 [Candidatus Brocadia sp.]